LTQRNSRHGLFARNTFICSSAGFGEYAAHLRLVENQFQLHPDPSVVAGIFVGGKDVEFARNDVRCGQITGGSGWGVVLADFIGPSEYAPYVGEVKIADNTVEFEAADKACIGVFAADTSVTGNRILAKGSALGIHAEGPLLQSNLIQGNMLSMDSGDGILIVVPATGGSRTVVTRNSLSGSGSHGIFIDAHGAPNGGGVRVSENLIDGFQKQLRVK
jgi:hypothetical protein